jgi:esterase/lipase superfamily enzyme
VVGVESYARLATICLVLIAGACADRPANGVLIPTAVSAAGTSRVTILAASTRQRSITDPGEMFGSGRAADVSYASVTVSIPPDGSREVGNVQWPKSLPGDPSRDFVATAANYLDKQAFVSSISAAVKETGRNKVLVFVHGFNNRFDDAVYRFAQIVHDSRAPGIPVLFTWPSLGEIRLRAYTYDRESANYSRDALEELLDLLSANPNVKEINIVAHSMGNWVTLEALRGRSLRSGRIGDKVKNVMLVAADVDVDVFRTQIRRMGIARPRFMLFVSQKDEALALSKFIWDGVPRVGEINPEEEPYRTEFDQQKLLVFDLTNLKPTRGGSVHDIAFEDLNTVMGMIRDRLGETPAPGPRISRN